MSSALAAKIVGGVGFELHGDLVEHLVEPRGGQRGQNAGGLAGLQAEFADVLLGGRSGRSAQLGQHLTQTIVVGRMSGSSGTIGRLVLSSGSGYMDER